MEQLKSLDLNNNRTYLYIHFLLAVFVFLCFRGGIDNFFTGDDFDWIFDALKMTHHPSSIISLQGEFIRPMETVFFFVNMLIAGGSPIAHHLSAIFLHILNVILLSCCISHICKNRLAGILGALFWGLNYKHTEVVFLTYGISDAFVLLFWFGAFLCFLNSRKFGATVCFILSLLSKEISVLFPVLVTVYVIVCIRSDKKIWCKRTIPLWILTVLYLGFRSYVTGRSSYLAIDWQAIPRFWENMLSQLGPDATYIKIVWLGGKAYLLSAWVAGILFVVLGLVIWKLPRLYRFGLLWMCITMLPTVFIVHQTSRYRYIPLVGLGIIVGQGMNELLTSFWKKRLQNAIVAVCTAYSLIIFYFVAGVALEEQDYALYGKIHHQAVQSFRQNILPNMSKDPHMMALFLKPMSNKWTVELYAKFLLKPWFFPGTYKWVYQRPYGVLRLSNTYGFVSYCAYSAVNTLFVNVPYEEFRKRLLSGDFYVIEHDYEANIFRFGEDTSNARLLEQINDKEFYKFLQPGRFDPTNSGTLYF